MTGKYIEPTDRMPDPDPQISAALNALAETLGEGLLGVYLHGSAVSGWLGPQSDIDLLAVIDRSLTDDQRDSLLAALLRLSARHPRSGVGPRCLEVMVFTRADLADRTFPMQADFVYGEWLRDDFQSGLRPMPGRDPENTLVLALAARNARPLIGPDPDMLLPGLPIDAVRDAMRAQLPVLLDGLRDDTRNVLLTLSRMWHSAATGSFATKAGAAEWVIARLPADHAPVLDHARRAHLGTVLVDVACDADAAQRLAAYLAAEVRNALAGSD